MAKKNSQVLNKKTKTEEDLARLQLAKKITSLLKEGKLLNNAYDADELNDLAKPYGLKNIKVIANYREYPVFRYETEIPHEKFNIIEDKNESFNSM